LFENARTFLLDLPSVSERRRGFAWAGGQKLERSLRGGKFLPACLPARQRLSDGGVVWKNLDGGEK